MSLKPKKSKKTSSYKKQIEKEQRERRLKKLKQETNIRKSALKIIKRLEAAESFAELHNIDSDSFRLRLNKFEAAAIDKASSARFKEIKKEKAKMKGLNPATGKYSCYRCGKSFKSEEAWRRHVYDCGG